MGSIKGCGGVVGVVHTARVEHVFKQDACQTPAAEVRGVRRGLSCGRSGRGSSCVHESKVHSLYYNSVAHYGAGGE